MFIYFLKEQMHHQLKNIQVAQYYTDDEYDPMAPNDLKAALGMTDVDISENVLEHHYFPFMQADRCLPLWCPISTHCSLLTKPL